MPQRKQGPIPTLHNFIYSSVAASVAVVFTNPIDVAKTRLQLQGIALEKGGVKHKLYRGPFDCIVKTIQVEGVTGSQRGLTTAIVREAALNFFRLGMFEPVLHFYHQEDTPAPLWKKIAAGVTTGSTAALICNPLDLMKTRMQAQASGKNATVGYQHKFAGVLDGFSTAVREDGVLGLWKGVSPSLLRLALGSSAQLASYSHIKEYALRNEVANDGPFLHIGTSFASVVFGVTAMNPVDVIRTRLYNEQSAKSQSSEGPKYKSGIDAAYKIARYEGPSAFFKGWFAHYLRGAPHVAIIFVLLEQLKKRRPLEKF